MTKFALKVLAVLLATALTSAVAGFVGGLIGSISGMELKQDEENRRNRRDSWHRPDDWTDADTREVTRCAGQLLGRRVVAVAMGGVDNPGDESYTTYHFEGGVDLVTQHFFWEDDSDEDDSDAGGPDEEDSDAAGLDPDTAEPDPDAAASEPA